MRTLHRFSLLAVATATILVAGGASAAVHTDLHQVDLARVKQSNTAIAASGAADMVHTRHAQALGLDADSRLFLLDRKTDLGVRNHRYQQTFRGLPIFGEHVVVNEDTNGNISTLFGRKIEGLAREIPAGKPRLSSNSAHYWPARFIMSMRVIRRCCCCTGGRIAWWPLYSRRRCMRRCEKPVYRANCV